MPVTYYDADLLLRVYDLRRETRLREARDFVLAKCSFQDYQDFKQKYPEESRERRHVGMVFSYWDMVCALVSRGLLEEELFNTCTTEHVILWLKYKPVITGMRADYEFPALLASLEQVATRHPLAAKMEKWVAEMTRKEEKPGSISVEAGIALAKHTLEEARATAKEQARSLSVAGRVAQERVAQAKEVAQARLVQAKDAAEARVGEATEWLKRVARKQRRRLKRAASKQATGVKRGPRKPKTG